MDEPKSRGGWRRWWTAAAGIYFFMIVLMMLALFPSRAEFTRAWRMQALDIERQFDMGLHGVKRELIQQRYAGLGDRDTVRLIQHKFERMYPESRQLDSSEALTSRYLNNYQGGAAAVAARSSDMLVWRDNDGIRLTRETAQRLRGDLLTLEARYSQKLRALPLQKSRVMALGLGLGGAALGLLWLLGLYCEKPRKRAAPRIAPPAEATPGLRLSLPDFSGLRAALASWMRPTLGH